MYFSVIKKGLCYCKKDYYDIDNNLRFIKDQIYKFEFEDNNNVWVIFDENGDALNTGRRFYLPKNNSIDSKILSDFYEYFELARKAKLNILNNISNNSE